jgi:hypothetical protein
VGQINLVGNVTTYSNQVFRGASMTATASSPGGNVVFSVFDPNASVSFILPINNGQTALLTPNGSDRLVVNGNTNLIGMTYSQNRALGYVPPSTTEINYAQLSQRSASLDLMDFLDDEDELKAVVDVGMPEINGGGVNCSDSAQEGSQKKSDACRAGNI